MRKTILIVDFEQESTEELQHILTTEDFQVLTAADGHQALAVFEAEKPDLVLTEALLPKLNGFELCKKITNGELREVRPVIMYSAIYKGEKYQKEAISGCGALEFLDKPIPKWRLLKAVRTAFSDAPNVRVDDARNVSSAAGIKASGAPGPVSLGHDVGNPLEVLEVDSLFDTAPSEEVAPRLAANAETVVLEGTLAESKPSLMPSIDSEEIDAALDSVRLDLHQEVQQRDELIAQQFEQELQQQEGQSILEFEAALAANPGSPEVDGKDENREFELDEVLPHVATQSSRSAPEVVPESIGPAAPNFAIEPAARTWLPILVLGLVALVAVVCFWFWSS